MSLHGRVESVLILATIRGRPVTLEAAITAVRKRIAAKERAAQRQRKRENENA